MQPPGWQGTSGSEAQGNRGVDSDQPAMGEAAREAEGARAVQAARYEDFLRSAVDWLWETDAALALTHATAPVAARLGRPAQALVGHALVDLGRFEPGRGSDERAEEAIQARRPFRGATFVMTDSDGREIAFRLSGVPVFDEESGRFAGYRGTAVATETGRQGEPEAPGDADLQVLADALEETLLRHQELAWRLTRLKARAGEPRERAPETREPGQARPEASLRRTAHELRTPLNAVVGYADLALREAFGPLSERYQDCFRTIREAGRHLERIVTQLSQTDEERAAEGLAARVVEVPATVAKAKALVALAAKAADVDISRVGPMAGGRVVGDEVAITQILVNLLGNAVKFTPAGGSIGLETLAGPQETLQIVVWDTGIGIPPEEQAKIFEPSYRAKSTGHGSAAPGLGLGLAISRELARRMGGDITVASQPGQGSRFVLTLPLAAEPSQSGA